MKNNNNQVQVNFPNGLSRKRNCSTTVVPDDRRKVVQMFPAHADVYSRTDYAQLQINEIIEKIDAEKMRSDTEYEHGLISGLSVLALSELLLAIFLIIFKN